jgi:hypothetical protein
MCFERTGKPLFVQVTRRISENEVHNLFAVRKEGRAKIKHLDSWCSLAMLAM